MTEREGSSPPRNPASSPLSSTLGVQDPFSRVPSHISLRDTSFFGLIEAAVAEILLPATLNAFSPVLTAI